MIKQKLNIIGIISTSLPLLLLTGNSAIAAKLNFFISGARPDNTEITVGGSFTYDTEGTTNDTKFPSYEFKYKNAANGDKLTIKSTNNDFTIPDIDGFGDPIKGIADVDPSTYVNLQIGQSIDFTNGRIPPGNYKEPSMFPDGFLNRRFNGTITRIPILPEPLTILGSGFTLAALPVFKKAQSKNKD